MKTLLKFKKLALAFFIIASLTTCKKQNEWLDVKRDKSDVVPETLADFQAILDNNRDMQALPTAGLAGTDNFYFTDANFLAAPEVDRNLYVWNKQIWVNGTSIDWTYPYRNIAYANIVLEGLEKLSPSTNGYDNVKGQAKFWRAFSFYNLAQIFCKPYDATTANSDLGLPLRTTSDFNIIFQRSTLQATYELIISDLKDAIVQLNETAPFATRPIRAAAAGLLARTYLTMGDYLQAFNYADMAFKLRSNLLDYNNNSITNTTLTYRFPELGTNNPEVLFFVTGGGYTGLSVTTSSIGFVNPSLYTSYNTNDLRKTLMFINPGNDNQVRARGTYTGRASNFNGIGVNEVLLIRAECYARNGKSIEAITDLNLLLKHRFKTGNFVPVSAVDADQALLTILVERRKELLFTGNLRWEDLRRLNKETRFATTLNRTINGTNYTLLPNDVKYVLPIPDFEIQQTGLTQNNR